MNIQNYNFEGGLEIGFKSLFSASDMELRVADDIDEGGLPDECVRFELDAGGPISNEHQNASGEYDNYSGTFEIEIRTPRVGIDAPTPIPVDGYTISGAGVSEVNGTYIRTDSDYANTIVYVLYDQGVPVFYLMGIPGLYWALTEFAPGVGGSFSYTAFGNYDTPPSSGWDIGPDGTAPAPTVLPADGILFKSRHIELVAKTRQLLEEIGATEISTHWPDAHAPTKIKPTGTSRETDAEFRYTRLSYEMQFRIT